MINKMFDAVFCLNLKRRPDRLDRVIEQSYIHGFQFEVIEAIDGSRFGLPDIGEMLSGLWFKHGAMACSLSHMMIHRIAIDRKLNNFLLLEDDVELDPNFNEKMQDFWKEKKSDWDMLYLGGNHAHFPSAISPNIDRCNKMLTTHAVAYNHTVFNRFFNALQDFTKPCDLHYAESHHEINAYSANPLIAWQRPDYSDVLNCDVDYSFMKPAI